MDTFKKKFVEEAVEHINDLEKSLLLLEQSPDNKEIIEKVFRSMHSLKGGGAMFGFERISEFTHDLETVYDQVRNGKMSVSTDLLSLTLASVDHLKSLLNEDNELSGVAKVNHASLLEQITRLANGNYPKNAEIQSNKSDNAEEMIEYADLADTSDENTIDSKTTYYISFTPNEDIFDNGTNPLYLIDELTTLGQILAIPVMNKLPDFSVLKPDNCFTRWEILLSTNSQINDISDVFIFVEDNCQLEINKLSNINLLANKSFVSKVKELQNNNEEIGFHTLQHIINQIDSTNQQIARSEGKKSFIPVGKDSSISSIRVSSDKLDQLMNLVSELVTTQARLSLYAENEGIPELIAIAENVQKLSRQLRDNAFSIVLIPIENMLTRFQRLVRDLSNELNKDVIFISEGAETELDKTVIENITDPLMHILRNSLDHGIEDPEVRIKFGKPRQGTIKLSAFYSGANVHIQVKDDGAGIDPDKIRKKAVNMGLISPDANLSRKEIIDLIFQPGFSTASRITDVSGRGVGMDVVRRKIADIRGEVEIDSQVGLGTTITFKLPLTLSIIDGLLVKIDDTHFIIPLSAVEKIYAVEHSQLVNRFNSLVVLDGEQVPFFHLREEFGLEYSSDPIQQVVVIKFEDKKVGLVVDYVIGEYQAVLKPLGKHYKKQEIISGATILGDGTVALVFDTNKTVKKFANIKVLTEEL